MKKLFSLGILFFLAACQVQRPEIILAEKPPLPAWEEVSCEELTLPQNQHPNLTCKIKQGAFCSFFENGHPYYGEKQTETGKTAYLTNKWGSSVTVTVYDKADRPLTERYYAYGEMKRAANFEYEKNLISRIWWDENQIRLYQTNTAGRTLNKFYFSPKGTFIQYPDGNDMGEITGNWQREGNKIYLEGNFLYELPTQNTAPDLCQVFDGACAVNYSMK